LIKIRDIVYDENTLQQAISQETTIWVTHEGMNSDIRASKLFKKVISELLTVDVKIDEEDKVLILISLLPQSYDHIVTIMFYCKKTLILEEVTSTLLSNEIRKRPNQEENK